MRELEGKKGAGQRARWMGTAGLAVALGLAVPGQALGQWTGGTGTTPIYDVDSNSKVGIGIATPAWDLHVKGQSGQHVYIELEAPSSSKQAALLFYEFNGTQSTQRWSLASRNGVDSPTNRLAIYESGSTERFTIVPGTGNVGIGTNNPQSKLAVNGTITAKDVTVTTAGWSDHVFAEGYELMPLPEVGRYIERNGRLPGVPSAAEVAEKGVSVGQTQAKLLEKVEELTLYALQMEQDNARLRQELTLQKQAVEQQMQTLEQRLARLERN